MWAPGKADPLARGLLQIEGYLDRLGPDRGVLVLFDRRQDAAPIHERTVLETATTGKGHAIDVLRA